MCFPTCRHQQAKDISLTHRALKEMTGVRAGSMLDKIYSEIWLVLGRSCRKLCRTTCSGAVPTASTATGCRSEHARRKFKAGDQCERF